MGGFSTNFFQKLIQIHKMWLKLAKIGNNWPIFKLFSAIFTFFRSWNTSQTVKRMITFKNETFNFFSKNLNFWSLFQILATIYEVKISFWKKLVENPPMTLSMMCPLHIMLRDLLTQKCVHKQQVTDFGYPRACRIRKH
jgi:hypothetical protein